MKQHTHEESKAMAEAENNLFSAIMSVENIDQCRRLFIDLCTPAELESMIDRWRVAELLQRKLSYREINNLTGVSVTTIGRVARSIDFGVGGYQLALAQMSHKIVEKAS